MSSRVARASGAPRTSRPPVSSGPVTIVDAEARARARPRARRGRGWPCVVQQVRRRQPLAPRPRRAAGRAARRSRRTRPSRRARRRRRRRSRASPDPCSARSARAVRYSGTREGGRMAGLMSRASTIIKAKFSKLLDRAEDPGETLDYSYEKQLELLQNVKRGIADVVTAKKRLELQQAQLEQSVVKLDGAGAPGRRGGPRGPRARRRSSASRRSSSSSQGLDVQVPAARGAAGEARRRAEAAPGEDRGLPHAEGSDQGAVLGRRGAGEDRRGGDRDRRADGRHRARDPAREGQDRADAGARGAIDELIDSGALEDFTSTGDDIDRQLAALSSQRRSTTSWRRSRPSSARATTSRRSCRRDRPADARGAVRGARLAAGRAERGGRACLAALAAGDVEALNASIEEMWEIVRRTASGFPPTS